MFIRTVLFIFSFAQFAAPLSAEPDAPPRPKVTATPEPKPQPRRTARRSTPKTPEQWLDSYMPKVKSALGARWGAAITARLSEFAPGALSVNFTLDANGAVTAFAVTTNTSNEPFAKFCDEFVRATKFEPPPPGALADGQIQIPFTFTIL